MQPLFANRILVARVPHSGNGVDYTLLHAKAKRDQLLELREQPAGTPATMATHIKGKRLEYWVLTGEDAVQTTRKLDAAG